MDSKPIWQSRTVWTNFILGAAGFYPPAHDWIGSHGMVFSVGVMLLNVALRSITTKKLDWNWSLTD